MILLDLVGHVAKARVADSKLSERAISRRLHARPRGGCPDAISLRLIVGFCNRLCRASALDKRRNSCNLSHTKASRALIVQLRT